MFLKIFFYNHKENYVKATKIYIFCWITFFILHIKIIWKATKLKQNLWKNRTQFSLFLKPSEKLRKMFAPFYVFPLHIDCQNIGFGCTRMIKLLFFHWGQIWMICNSLSILSWFRQLLREIPFSMLKAHMTIFDPNFFVT